VGTNQGCGSTWGTVSHQGYGEQWGCPRKLPGEMVTAIMSRRRVGGRGLSLLREKPDA
jgi:hypothetical protein